MHDTLSINVKGYIDKCQNTGNTTECNGWAFHLGYGICPLRAVMEDTIVENTETTIRTDVANSYKKSEIASCGWKFILEKEGEYSVQMFFENTWVNIFTLKHSNYNSTLSVGSKKIPTFLVVDNFYENPDSVREFALKQDFKEHKSQHKGMRTEERFWLPGVKERFEELLGCKVKNWDDYRANGTFQYCVAGDQLVYHQDIQEYAGLVFLTPDAPPQTGTKLFRSKFTKKMTAPYGTEEFELVYKSGFLDATNFELVDVVGNVYNRLVIFNGRNIHAASEYFGTTKENGRLFQLFFFDIDRS